MFYFKFCDVLSGGDDVLFLWESFLVIGMGPMGLRAQVLKVSFTVIGMVNLGESGDEENFLWISHWRSNSSTTARMVALQKLTLINS